MFSINIVFVVIIGNNWRTNRKLFTSFLINNFGSRQSFNCTARAGCLTGRIELTEFLECVCKQIPCAACSCCSTWFVLQNDTCIRWLQPAAATTTTFLMRMDTNSGQDTLSLCKEFQSKSKMLHPTALTCTAKMDAFIVIEAKRFKYLIEKRILPKCYSNNWIPSKNAQFNCWVWFCLAWY